MNERIKLLSDQADLYARSDNSSMLMKNYKNLYTEKFAELIIQECLDVLNKRFMGDLNREDMEVLRCVEDVERHFGMPVV
jgi:hypothetical protein